MNEIDLLNRWERPAIDPDAMADARERLDAVMLPDAMGVVTTVRPARRRLAARALIAAAVTIVLATGAVVVLQRQVDDRVNRIHRSVLPAGTLDPSNVPYPMTILVVGSDSRAFVDNATQAQAFGSAQSQTGQRSDVMALVRLTATTTTAVWIPRDVMVDDHGTPRQLNSYFNDGPQALIEAIRANLHVEVNHYVQVNFTAFIKVVDAIGSVHLYVPTPMRDTFSGLNVSTPGCTTFNGDRALAWVRSRHLETFVDGKWIDASGRSDLDRVARQQQFVRILLAKFRADVGRDLGRAADIADSVVRALTVDSGFSNDEILSLVRRFVRDDPSTWILRTAPVEASPSDANRLVIAGPTGEELFRPVISDSPAPQPPSAPGLGDPC